MTKDVLTREQIVWASTCHTCGADLRLRGWVETGWRAWSWDGFMPLGHRHGQLADYETSDEVDGTHVTGVRCAACDATLPESRAILFLRHVGETLEDEPAWTTTTSPESRPRS